MIFSISPGWFFQLCSFFSLLLLLLFFLFPFSWALGCFFLLPPSRQPHNQGTPWSGAAPTTWRSTPPSAALSKSTTPREPSQLPFPQIQRYKYLGLMVYEDEPHLGQTVPLPYFSGPPLKAGVQPGRQLEGKPAQKPIHPLQGEVQEILPLAPENSTHSTCCWWTTGNI